MCKTAQTYLKTTEENLASLVLKPHKAVLVKLLKLRKCKSRKEIDGLEVDREQLKSLLEGKQYQDRSGQQQLLRICDSSLSDFLGLTAKRWNYLKGVLLRDKVIGKRAQ